MPRKFCVIGGAEVYAATSLTHASRIYLTQVHATVVGDTHFPLHQLTAWREIERVESIQPMNATRMR